MEETRAWIGMGRELPDRRTHFENVWFEFTIDEHVEAENFEASASTVMVREARAVVMFENGMSRYQSFNHNVVDVRP
mgnify:CR=1 FL=1